MSEIEALQRRLMDWVQMTTAFATGAAGLMTLQTIIKRMKSKREDEPVNNRERRTILRELAALNQSFVSQDATMERVEGRMERMDDRLTDQDDRLRSIEREVSRWRGQGQPRQGSTD